MQATIWLSIRSFSLKELLGLIHEVFLERFHIIGILTVSRILPKGLHAHLNLCSIFLVELAVDVNVQHRPTRVNIWIYVVPSGRGTSRSLLCMSSWGRGVPADSSLPSHVSKLDSSHWLAADIVMTGGPQLPLRAVRLLLMRSARAGVERLFHPRLFSQSSYGVRSVGWALYLSSRGKSPLGLAWRLCSWEASKSLASGQRSGDLEFGSGFLSAAERSSTLSLGKRGIWFSSDQYFRTKVRLALRCSVACLQCHSCRDN